MSNSNYRDISTQANDLSAGFQFEFYCERCGESQRSAFSPYRRGQMTGWLSRLLFAFRDLHSASRVSGIVSDAGLVNAKAEALAQAQAAVQGRYQFCGGCQRRVGNECWNPGAQRCNDCSGKVSHSSMSPTAAPQAQFGGGSPANAGGMSCPQCNTPSQGSRFCTGCGFDTASIHKACPACGAVLPRQARFCNDCGHGF